LLKKIISSGCDEHDPEPGIACDVDNREIYFFGNVNDAVAEDIIINLRALDRVSGANISLIINSGGGDINSGFAIYDTMEACRSKIIGTVLGSCCSMASLIFQGCDTRIIAKNARFMIHDASMTIGEVSKLELHQYIKELKSLDGMYNKILADRAGLDIDTVEDLRNKETYLSAEQVVEYGWADYVLGEAKKKSNQAKMARKVARVKKAKR
jgi:ATP-dependent Clp protease protease subunit